MGHKGLPKPPLKAQHSTHFVSDEATASEPWSKVPEGKGVRRTGSDPNQKVSMAASKP